MTNSTDSQETAVNVMKPHTDPPAYDPEDRLCVCLDDRGSHVSRGVRVPCTECGCRDFACWSHTDNDCFSEPSR